MIDYSATRGVIVLVDDEWNDDGDAYTVAGVSRPEPTTPPVVSALVPDTAAHTDAPLDVLVQGSDFVHGDRVLFGGASPPTSYHDDTELAVRIDPTDWSAGSLDVRIGYSSRGPSNALPFAIT